MSIEHVTTDQRHAIILCSLLAQQLAAPTNVTLEALTFAQDELVHEFFPTAERALDPTPGMEFVRAYIRYLHACAEAIATAQAKRGDEQEDT